ncbi:hypothetical protein QYE76_071716 [Lolium multiflorum]|uniref:Uncharacterized protein n=1 Tax=Lolium multiflorum TaxID=4521 RepID=A0AAD8WEV0_LOLMU|nr:hypothetical protein QYE76_071716 [Lolium multiflorum]
MAEQEKVVNGSLPGEQSPPPSIVDSTPATLDDLKKLDSSIVCQMKAMMMELMAPKPTPIIDPKASVDVPPQQVNTLPLVDFVAQSTKPPREGELEDVVTSSKGKDEPPVAGQLGGNHVVPPPSDYTVNVPIPMPHILSHGSPPLLESNSFENWQFLMRSHVRSASTELWRIIEEGYSPRDPKNLTRREVVDDQLNATAINMIHMAVTPKDHAHIRSLKTAKEAWDKLDKLFLGNESIQSSRFDEVNNMADNFVMNEGESPEEMYRRLIALTVQMQDLGATFVGDHWTKRKFYNTLLPYEEVKWMAIRQNASFRAMTSDKVLSEFSSNSDDTKVSFTKKPRAFIIREEYSSDEGEEREDKGSNKEEEGVATIAISTPSISLFDSPNENLATNNSCCLVAKVSLEVESPSEHTPSSNAISIVGLDASLTNMLGDTKTHVEAPLTQLCADQDRIGVKAANEIISLTQAHEKELKMRMALEVSAIVLEDSNNSIISHLTKDRDHALGWVDELKMKKRYLEESHEWLLEEVATLTKNFKSLESKFVLLSEMRRHPQEEAHKKEEDEGPNSCCDKLLDEVCSLRRHNARLLEVNSLQEEALDEYYRLSKEKNNTLRVEKHGSYLSEDDAEVSRHTDCKNVQVYIDDVIITTKQGSSLMDDLRETFDNLDKFRLKLNPTKCSVGVHAGELLGYLVLARGIEANPEKIQAIVTMRKPTKLKEIQQLTGRVAALSRFVARLGEKASMRSSSKEKSSSGTKKKTKIPSI